MPKVKYAELMITRNVNPLVLWQYSYEWVGDSDLVLFTPDLLNRIKKVPGYNAALALELPCYYDAKDDRVRIPGCGWALDVVGKDGENFVLKKVEVK